ncbi:MAG: hypothetical protein HY238_18660, partial [Acidobacteria bacterium]|nr:hypothetical protein [Acidobacteriota bacterium]
MLAAGVCRLLFEALTPSFATPVLTLAGACFGTGAVGFVLWVWATIHSLAAPTILILAALPPLVVGLLCLGEKPLVLPALPSNSRPLSLRPPATMLLVLALIFQFGTQWAAGGWLALYWIRRLGVSSTTALIGLALYWIMLTLGLLLSAGVAPLSRPLRSLTARFAASLFGSVLLLSTAGVGGAVVGVLFLGAGIGTAGSMLLSLIAERLPWRRPRVFRSLFRLALVGGLLAPAATGYLAHFGGIEWAIRVPALGAVMVYLLLSAVLLKPSVDRIWKTVSSKGSRAPSKK